MIGAALSMHFVGKKPWGPAIIFWAVVLVAGIVASAIVGGSVLGILAGPAIFIGLAHYWYKFDWIKSILIFAVAYVIDIVIIMLLAAIIGVSILGGIFGF